jgi:hypothetical protein
MITLNRRSRIVCWLPLFVVTFQMSMAQAQYDSLATLESAVRKETEKAKGSGFENGNQPRNAGLILLTQLREAIGRNDSRQTDAALAEIVALFESAPVRAVASKLRGELHVEQAAREKERLAKIKAVLASASVALKTARRPVDLDGTIRDLRNLPEQQESGSAEIREQLQKAQSARQFVLLWQDYLAADAAGNAERAQQALQSASGIATDLMARSQILSRSDEISKRKGPDPAGQARQIAAKVKSLDDIPGALDALAALEPKPGISAGDYHGLVETLRLELSRISQVYREYQAGLPTSLQIRGFDAPTPNEETFRTILPLKVQLLRTIVPRALEVDEKLKPNPEEPIRGYLDRIAALAFEKGDLRLLVRARDLRNKLDGVLLSSAAASVSQSLLAGLNQEEAGQWAAAVVSYETALKYGADVVPARHIGERLEKMKAAHPREFEQGFQRFMTGLQPVPPNPAANAADKIVIPEAPAPVQSVSPASPP